MRVTFAGYKGGVGKTMSAIHFAALIASHTNEPTILVDGDPNRSAVTWSHRRDTEAPLTFSTRTLMKALDVAAQFRHFIVDTKARPDDDDLRPLLEDGDFVVLPTTVDAMSLDALLLLVRKLRDQPDGEARVQQKVRVLITMVPPPWPNRNEIRVRNFLREQRIPVLRGFTRRLAAYQLASLQGRLVCEVKDERADVGWRDYDSAVRDLLART